VSGNKKANGSDPKSRYARYAQLAYLVLPLLSLISFIWVMTEYRTRQAGVDSRTGLDSAGMPFFPIQLTSFGYLLVVSLILVSFLFAVRRRGVTAGLCAVAVLIIMFIARLGTFMPD